MLTRNKLHPGGIGHAEPNQVRVAYHVPFPLDDGDAGLILLPHLLKQPCHPPETNMERVFTHGGVPPAEAIHARLVPGRPARSGADHHAAVSPAGACRAFPLLPQALDGSRWGEGESDADGLGLLPRGP